MKSVCVCFLLIFCFAISVFTQSLSTEKVKTHKWRKGTQLICQNDQHQLIIPVRSVRDKKSKSRLKLVQLDGRYLRMEIKPKSLRIKTMEGETLVLAGRRRMEVHIGDQMYFRKKKVFKNQIDYVDEQGTSVLTARMSQRRILITPELPRKEGIDVLMIICFEEMIRRIEESHDASLTAGYNQAF